MKNKAHTATLNRICRRFGVTTGKDFDVQTDEMIIEVETSATLANAVDRLKLLPSPTYVALTNKEGIKLAVSTAQGTGVGIMDPKGDIILAAETLAPESLTSESLAPETAETETQPVFSETIGAIVQEAGVAN